MNRERWASVEHAACSPEELEQAQACGYAIDPAETHFVGRDPRTMTVTELEAMGHQRMSQGAAIRAKCLDCCAGNAAEVRRCVAVACPSWPYRMGSNPWRAPLSEAQLEASRKLGQRFARKIDSGASNQASAVDSDAGTGEDGRE